MIVTHRCGSLVDDALFMCPACGCPLDELNVPTPSPVASGSASHEEEAPSEPAARCSTPWCRRELPPGSNDCPFCGAPVAATATPARQVRASAAGGVHLSLLLPGGTEVPLDSEIVLGRDTGDPLIDAALDPFDGVSRRHASLTPVPGGVRVIDLGSLNGTTVNGIPVSGSLTPVPPAVTIGLGRKCSLTLIPS